MILLKGVCAYLCACSLCACAAADQDADFAYPRSTIMLLLADTWRQAPDTPRLEIDKAGDFRILSSDDSVLVTGRIEPVLWSKAASTEPQIQDTVVLRAFIADRWFLLPGYYLHGEGEAPALAFCLGAHLRACFAPWIVPDRESGTLWLSGTGP